MPLGNPHQNWVDVLDQEGRRADHEAAPQAEEQSYRVRADVTRPMVDPNKSARRYLQGN